jgi:hypothetical protein
MIIGSGGGGGMALRGGGGGGGARSGPCRFPRSLSINLVLIFGLFATFGVALYGFLNGEFINNALVSWNEGSFEQEGCQSPTVADAPIQRQCSSPLSLPCFDRSRCEPGRFSAYVYDEDCTLKGSSEIYRDAAIGDGSRPDVGWRMALQDTGSLSETPEEACLLIYVIDRRRRGVCVNQARVWNGGVNHLIVSEHDQGRNRFKFLVQSKAMFAESHALSCFHRAGYDISLPLQPKAVYPEYRKVPPNARKYFLTYKGTTKLDGLGTFRQRLDPLDDPGSGVVIVSQCHPKKTVSYLPENVDYCASLSQRYSETDYYDLMNTTFALIPGGRQPATYRLGEALAAGSIPVWWGPSYILPFATEGGIDWSTCAFAFPLESLHNILPTLRQVSAEKAYQMQQACLSIYQEAFEWQEGRGPWGGIIRKTLTILDKRIAYLAS